MQCPRSLSSPSRRSGGIQGRCAWPSHSSLLRSPAFAQDCPQRSCFLTPQNLDLYQHAPVLFLYHDIHKSCLFSGIISSSLFLATSMTHHFPAFAVRKCLLIPLVFRLAIIFHRSSQMIPFEQFARDQYVLSQDQQLANKSFQRCSRWQNS